MGPLKPIIFLLLCVFYTANCAGNDKKNDEKIVSVLLKDIKGKPNELLTVAVKDPLNGAPTITTKKPFKMNLMMYMYSADDDAHIKDAKLLHSYKVCDLLLGGGEKSKVPQFPVEMVNLIFIDQDGCNFQAGSKDITMDANLPYIPANQHGFSLPNKKRFVFLINIVDEQGKSDPKKKYLITTTWEVAVIPQTKDSQK